MKFCRKITLMQMQIKAFLLWLVAGNHPPSPHDANRRGHAARVGASLQPGFPPAGTLALPTASPHLGSQTMLPPRAAELISSRDGIGLSLQLWESLAQDKVTNFGKTPISHKYREINHEEKEVMSTLSSHPASRSARMDNLSFHCTARS